MITTEEEVDLTIRIRNGEDLALKKLVLANLRFVIKVAKQYQNQGLSFSDLIKEGNLGLAGTRAYSLQEIAMRYNMSSERVRQIRSNGIMKLKQLLEKSSTFLDY